MASGFAPLVAFFAASAMTADVAAAPDSADSTAVRRSGTGSGSDDPYGGLNQTGNDGAGAEFDQRPFGVAAADRALVERALAGKRHGQRDAADRFARLQRVIGAAV